MNISLVITTGLFLITFFDLRTSQQDLEISKQENEMLLSKLKEKEAQIKEFQEKIVDFKHISHSVSNTTAQVQTQGLAQKSKISELDKERFNEEEASDAKEYVNVAQRKIIRQMTEKQYQSLIKELGINGEQKEALISAVSSLGTKEGAFNLKFFDAKVTNEDLYEEQVQIYDDFIKELQNNFDDQIIEKIVTHKHENGFKLSKKMYIAHLSDLELTDQEQKSIENIFGEHLRSNAAPPIGNFTREYIQDFRDKYKGMSMGSPEFTKVTIEITEEQNNSLLAKLEKTVSPEVFQKLKSKLDASTQMLKAAIGS